MKVYIWDPFSKIAISRRKHAWAECHRQVREFMNFWDTDWCIVSSDLFMESLDDRKNKLINHCVQASHSCIKKQRHSLRAVWQGEYRRALNDGTWCHPPSLFICDRHRGDRSLSEVTIVCVCVCLCSCVQLCITSTPSATPSVPRLSPLVSQTLPPSLRARFLVDPFSLSVPSSPIYGPTGPIYHFIMM